jgi:hypothetical protein
MVVCILLETIPNVKYNLKIKQIYSVLPLNLIRLKPFGAKIKEHHQHKLNFIHYKRGDNLFEIVYATVYSYGRL